MFSVLKVCTVAKNPQIALESLCSLYFKIILLKSCVKYDMFYKLLEFGIFFPCYIKYKGTLNDKPHPPQTYIVFKCN